MRKEEGMNRGGIRKFKGFHSSMSKSSESVKFYLSESLKYCNAVRTRYSIIFKVNHWWI